MAGEGALEVARTHESPLPTVISVREVETRAQLHDPAHQREVEARLAERSAHEPKRTHLIDVRIPIAGFNGSARIRVITEPHRADPPDPIFEWTVKVYLPRDGFKVVKAPIEHRGSAETPDAALAALATFLRTLGHTLPTGEAVEITEHDRTEYVLDDGTIANVDTFTKRNGEALTPQELSVEFERQLPPDATDDDVRGAEDEIIATAASVGISEDRLSPSWRGTRPH